MNSVKEEVKDFWNAASCGEDLYLKGFSAGDYNHQAAERYRIETQLIFGEFRKFKGKKTLEIGVGLGADHQQLAQSGAILSGIDLTERAINHTKRRFELFGLRSDLQVADAENLPFEDGAFEALYSWGVIHHSPNTPKVVDEIYRVLQKGALAKIMIYNKYSMIGCMLWLRYALLKGRPWLGLNTIYHHYLESLGTKAYSYAEARELFSHFEILEMTSPLTHGDLLDSEVGARHKGVVLDMVKMLWPRRIIKWFFPTNGLYLLLSLRKN